MDLCLKEFQGDPITFSIKLQNRLSHLSKDLGTCQGGRTPSLLLLLLLLSLLLLLLLLLLLMAYTGRLRPNGRYTKGVPFLSKMVYKRVRG